MFWELIIFFFIILQALVPITEEVEVPFEFHRFIIGQKGKDVRKMMEDHEVSITVPPPEEKSNIIAVTGPPSNVKGAKAALEERCVILENEKQDKVSFINLAEKATRSTFL